MCTLICTRGHSPIDLVIWVYSTGKSKSKSTANPNLHFRCIFSLILLRSLTVNGEKYYALRMGFILVYWLSYTIIYLTIFFCKILAKYLIFKLFLNCIHIQDRTVLYSSSQCYRPYNSSKIASALLFCICVEVLSTS
jgi:hypothetical protein